MAIKIGSSIVEFEINGEIYKLNKVTRLAYENYLSETKELKGMEDQTEAQKIELKASEQLILDAGLPEDVAKTLPLEAYGIILENLIIKKK